MEMQRGLQAFDAADLPRTKVGDGCERIDLPSRPGVQIWIVEMAPGARWPHIDRHDENGEDVFVVDGELIEGGRRLGPGSYLKFDAFSTHRPRTETGVRLFGFNLLRPGTLGGF